MRRSKQIHDCHRERYVFFAPNQYEEYQDILFTGIKQLCKTKIHFLDNHSSHDTKEFSKVSKDLLLNSKLTCKLPFTISTLIIEFSELYIVLSEQNC